MARATRDLCQDCWQDAHPTEYAPNLNRYDECSRCHQWALVARSHIDDESAEEAKLYAALHPSPQD